MYSVGELAGQLRQLGLSERSGVVLVHASLRTLGEVEHGSAGVLAALRSALGPGGTLLAFTGTPENSDTSRLDAVATRGLDRAALAAYRRAMPPFDPLTTPSSPSMGRLSEELRTAPGALRSAHPQTSFAALGPMSGALIADHPLDCHLGERSPIGRLYKAGGQVLMLGASMDRCTVLHLAQYRVPGAPRKRYGCQVTGPDGAPHWVRFEGLDLDDVHFPRLLAAIRGQLTEARSGRVGDADCLLLSAVQSVDAATEWLVQHPQALGL
ncbi:aminoglycoside N(3)-acetyltransferase [Kitasatospora sp. NBC_01266]|uniref:aminoglycoside N(3)-acetyltransferase n=1 Tax=Kitasatospora sp. NBC_01266 TaxID=2903572 RepID=UPI002E34E735|nr:AAC(3) family N-acetyltransferase [Kitasatospora sp. NBC_01266]